MAAHVELCALDPFPAGFNPLDALLPRVQLHTLLGEEHEADTELQAALLFTPHRAHRSRARGVFLRATGTELQLWRGAGRTDGVLRLWVSPQFLSLHPDLGPGSVRTLDPVCLDRVVLGVRGRSGLSAQDGSLVSGLLQRCGPLMLVERGEPFLVTDKTVDFLVLDCSPVSRGRVTPQTCVVLTDCYDWPDPLRTPPPAPSQPIRLCVSDFAVMSEGLSGRSLLEQRRLLGAGLSGILQALECHVDIRVSPVLLTPPFPPSDHSLLLPRRLLLKLGLCNHQWVRVSLGGGARERLVSVATIGDREADGQGAGLISTTLWFNLSEGEPLPVDATSLRIKRWVPESVPGRSETLSLSASPPLACELHLQPVRSLLYSCSTLNYNQILTEYFHTPRLVSVGDMLSVPVQSVSDLVQFSEGFLRGAEVLCFRVQRVCSAKEEVTGPHLADREHTSLYMGVATNSPAPFVCVGEASFWTRVDPPGLTSTVDRLCGVITPHLTHRSLGVCSVLLYGSEGSGKMTVIRAAAHRLHLHLIKVDCVSLCSDSLAASEVKMSAILDRAEEVRPCVAVLRNLHLLLSGSGGEQGRLQSTLGRLLLRLSNSVVVIATVPQAADLSAAVVPLFLHQVSLQSPGEEQRRSMIQGLTQDLDLGPDVDLARLAKVTAGSVLGDLNALVAEASREARHRLLQICPRHSEEELVLSRLCLQDQDFSSALRTLQHSQAQTVGAPKIPCVRWEDVGGLEDIKTQILDTVSLPLTRPELMSLGLNRTGLLLYGPPGTGKTLLAKAVATEGTMNFLSVKGPELINMYVGQSEENVRKVFIRARTAAPCVVFFDELDSLAPSRGHSGDSGGVMDRVVSQLLSELDSLQSSGVFVIGATNRPDLIDQSLLRPGRFDRLLYVGVSADRCSQLQVLHAILRKFDLAPCVDLGAILDQCPGHMTGADLYALCCDAMTSALKRKIGLIEQNCDSEDSSLCLCLEDFVIAVKDFKPSVSEQELQRYKDLQQTLCEK
ncbi:peroxisomal ATPase PEX6 [Periophthalmus magnuspinnatus]|uniref:peroxisomal ATPase PEX6 n=1 Tax=Periophthalmus magnuspinnatus TaxID=409849 RepID=UPI00145A1EE1|nr:peroxisomal ATPase PEX6 [Periophthalmus magnuspinnatus]